MERVSGTPKDVYCVFCAKLSLMRLKREHQSLDYQILLELLNDYLEEHCVHEYLVYNNNNNGVEIQFCVRCMSLKKDR